MQRRKSKRHQRAANARWRAAEDRAQAERDAGIPDEPMPADVRQPITIDLRSYGGDLVSIEPRAGYISVRVTYSDGRREAMAVKTLLHRLADALPRTLGVRNL